MSHSSLQLFAAVFGVWMGALVPPELWVCGVGCGGGAALPTFPSRQATMLIPSWGGRDGFAAFAAPSSGEYKVMMSARLNRFEGVSRDR